MCDEIINPWFSSANNTTRDSSRTETIVALTFSTSIRVRGDERESPYMSPIKCKYFRESSGCICTRRVGCVFSRITRPDGYTHGGHDNNNDDDNNALRGVRIFGPRRNAGARTRTYRVCNCIRSLWPAEHGRPARGARFDVGPFPA